MFSRWKVTNITSARGLVALALPQDSHPLRRSTRDLWTLYQRVRFNA
jgi:hypothetical protein